MAACHPRRRAPMTPSAVEAEAGPSLKGLQKGATFHSPSLGHTFVPPTLPRAQSNLDDAIIANRRRITLTLEDIDAALSKTKDLSLDDKIDNGAPLPRGFLDQPAIMEERKVLRPRSVRRSRRHASDSGLGSSVASSSDKLGKTSSTSSAITRSAAVSTRESLPALSPKAVSRITEHTLRPLLSKPSLKDFETIVLDVPRRIQSKEIICLRDLEKTLIFMAPEKTKSAVLYLDFTLTTVECLQATVEHLSDREQVRPTDRPYTNGYFLDLKEQLCQYGRQLAASKEGGFEHLDLDQSDEIKLYGGIAETGRPAELIRVKKDGTAISMATGQPIDLDETPIKIKRSLSEQREDEEEIMRSMARRKKNATPEELAPKKCREPGCTKQFKRPCDLTKHEKTHSRPWKCPHATCKYHSFGWPTEKEMDRHVNDKHSDAPAMYECLYKPCPYKSKRESNCKQHMEKAHGWTYVRTKNNGKKLPKSPDENTPVLPEPSTPSTIGEHSMPTPPQDHPQMMADIVYPRDWSGTYSLPTGELDMAGASPSSDVSYNQLHTYHTGSNFLTDEEIYAAAARVPQPQFHHSLYQKMAPLPIYQAPVLHIPQPQVQQPAQVQQAAQHQQPITQQLAPHYSPNGHGNTMLYTPTSLSDMEENMDNSFADADFPLFPAEVKGMPSQNLMFGEIPSANVGFSQQSQQELFHSVDWANCPSFSEEFPQ